MTMRYYISTEEASFFINNRMGYANSIPTSGNYKVGDFIISSTQEDGIFGWVCTVAGTPGEWEVIGSGMGNSGSVMHDKVVGYINAVSFSDARSSIEIGINEYEKGKDFLEVHYNGLMLAEGVHYNVSEDGKSIIALDEVWNENADDTQQMIFRVIKSEGVNVKELKNTININSACYEVEMGIEGYSPERDVVEVHLNGVLLVQGVDYEILEGRISKKDRSEAWNPYNVNGQKMFVRVFRNIANLVEPSDGSVTMEKLSPDVRSDVAAIDGLVSSMSIQNSTISNLNDRVSAIEEKIESGDIVTNGGGGGGPVKLTYKDNLVEVINTNNVAIGLPFNKEKDMLEVHIDGLKLAEGVHYNISEDGLSIVKVEGVWNPDSLEDQYIDFRVITAGNQQIDHLTRNVEFSSPMTEVEIGLEYNHGVDILIVHLNGIKLVEGLDFEYVSEGNKIVKIDTSEPWNLYGVDGQLFVIDVLRNVGEKVTMNDLADDVKQAIESAGNIDVSGKQDKSDNSLITSNKTIVGAINEVENETITIKNSLVDVLNNKGISCNTDQSWFELFGLLVNNISSGGGEDTGGEDTLLSGQWNSLRSIGTARSAIGVCAYKGKIYCLGGLKSGPAASNLFNCYDPSTDTWETLTPYPSNIFGAACLGMDEGTSGRIYVFATMKSPNSATCKFECYYYDIAEKNWTLKSSQTSNGKLMPSKAFYNEGDGRVYILNRDPIVLAVNVYTDFSGFDYLYDDGNYANFVLGSANCYHNGRIYSIGGYISDSIEMRKRVLALDISSNTVMELSPFPMFITGASAEVYDNKIYVFGGRMSTDSNGLDIPNTNMYVYDIDNDSWTEIADKGIEIVHTGTCIIDNKIYSIGGDTRSSIGIFESVVTPSNNTSVFVIGD